MSEPIDLNAMFRNHENSAMKSATGNAAGKDLKVFVVDDSALARKVLCDIINNTAGMRVAGTAANGKEALEHIPLILPDIVCTDFHMPVMNGAEFISQLMQHHPLPVLVVSVAVQNGETENIFNLLKAGALEVVAKPRLNALASPQEQRTLNDELTSKIRILSGVYVFRRNVRTSAPAAIMSTDDFSAFMTASAPTPKIVVIGASTGGPQTLKDVFMRLKWPLPYPIVCVQHISEGFQNGLLRWLTNEIHQPIEVATQGQAPVAGHIYFAAENRHLGFDNSGSFSYNDDAPESGARPASDVLFKSAAERFGKNTIGILLSGMGRDGASGLKKIANGGGLTIAQSEESCVVFGMPRAAIELGAARFTLGPAEIAAVLNKKFY